MEADLYLLRAQVEQLRLLESAPNLNKDKDKDKAPVKVVVVPLGQGIEYTDQR